MFEKGICFAYLIGLEFVSRREEALLIGERTTNHELSGTVLFLVFPLSSFLSLSVSPETLNYHNAQVFLSLFRNDSVCIGRSVRTTLGCESPHNNWVPHLKVRACNVLSRLHWPSKLSGPIPFPAIRNHAYP